MSGPLTPTDREPRSAQVFRRRTTVVSAYILIGVVVGVAALLTPGEFGHGFFPFISPLASALPLVMFALIAGVWPHVVVADKGVGVHNSFVAYDVPLLGHRRGPAAPHRPDDQHDRREERAGHGLHERRRLQDARSHRGGRRAGARDRQRQRVREARRRGEDHAPHRGAQRGRRRRCHWRSPSASSTAPPTPTTRHSAARQLGH